VYKNIVYNSSEEKTQSYLFNILPLTLTTQRC